MYRELLLGCGHKKEKRVVSQGTPREWQNLTTLDMNPYVNPDVITDLSKLYVDRDFAVCVWDEKLFGAESFDEIHAYEVLEHFGAQGDYGRFFQFFTAMWHLLKPNGLFCATVPSRYSEWLWGDPGHRRAILPATLIFLDQKAYIDQAGKTSMSDYRFCYKADFETVYSQDDRQSHVFILRAIKPSRIIGSTT
jgi:hypothetical protein